MVSELRAIYALLLAIMMTCDKDYFPQGRYLGYELLPKPYLRIDGDFYTPQEIGEMTGKVHLSVACGTRRANWDAWFDLARTGFRDMFLLREYQINTKYKEYMSFFTRNCGRGGAFEGDLAIFAVKNVSGNYHIEVFIGNATIMLRPMS